MKSFQYIVVLAGIALSAQSLYAQECQTDADCSASSMCEKSAVVSVSSDGTTTTESEVGYCVEKPIVCQTDADCPSYLACESFEGTVTVPACEGDNCPPVPGGMESQDTTTEMYCVVKEISCMADSECPTDFVCQTYEVSGVDCARPAIACDPNDPNCVEPELPPECDPANAPEPVVMGYCVPKQVECVQDSDCPSEWSCVEVGGSSCGSAGTATGTADPIPGDAGGASSGSEAGAPSEGAPLPVEENPCEPQVIKACMPKGYTSYGIGVAASNGSDLNTSAESGGTTTTSAEGGTTGSTETAGTDKSATTSSSSSSDNGGCQSSSNVQIAWFVVLSSLFFFRRKRTI